MFLISFYKYTYIPKSKWSTTCPSDSEYASFAPMLHEKVSLCISSTSESTSMDDQNNNNNNNNNNSNNKSHLLRYAQDRDIQKQSKKLIQHHLSALALKDIIASDIGLQWNKLTFKEIRNSLVQK
jgi:hypothetical protein